LFFSDKHTCVHISRTRFHLTSLDVQLPLTFSRVNIGLTSPCTHKQTVQHFSLTHGRNTYNVRGKKANQICKILEQCHCDPVLRKAKEMFSSLSLHKEDSHRAHGYGSLSRLAVLYWITCLLLPKLREQARAAPQPLLYQSPLTPPLPCFTSFTLAGDKLHSRQLTKKAHFL